MPASRKYPQELRERATRLVQESLREDPELSLNQAVRSVSSSSCAASVRAHSERAPKHALRVLKRHLTDAIRADLTTDLAHLTRLNTDT